MAGIVNLAETRLIGWNSTIRELVGRCPCAEARFVLEGRLAGEVAGETVRSAVRYGSPEIMIGAMVGSVVIELFGAAVEGTKMISRRR